MKSFVLQHIKRRMFVIINEDVIIADVKTRCSHGEWFKKEGWMSQDDYTFFENTPRGYADKEGVYIYQGHDARSPVLSHKQLLKIAYSLQNKLLIKPHIHIFLGTLPSIRTQHKSCKLPPQYDLGAIGELLQN